MSKMDIHFSSATPEWSTPQDFFDKYHAIYNFELDVAATPENAKCPAYFTKETDGLKQDWGTRRCWMNPPYGDPEEPCKKDRAGNYACKKLACKPVTQEEIDDALARGKKPPVRRGHHIDVYVPGIIDFMRKAYESALAGATVVCLVPSRTDTEWFQDYAMKGEVEFIRGRLKFGGHKDSAPFPSAVVVFKPGSVLP
jgi:phage N-6-adenine-methyltransferase